MNTSVVEIAAANVCMFLTGVGLLPLLGVARTPKDVLRRVALAYPVGLAAAGILSATLVVFDVPIGWPSLAASTVLALVLGARRAGVRLSLTALRRPAQLPVVGWLALAAATVFLVEAGRLLVVKPLSDNDAWQIWGLRAKALYDFGHPVSPIFTAPQYPALQHPLLLPAVQALDAHVIGRYDGTLLHVQLLGFAIAFVLGGWGLLRAYSSPALLGLTLLAVLTAPTFFDQLQTNYADVPVATFVALGVVALGVWISTDERSALALGALFLAAGALTKNEGEMFGLAVVASAAAVCGRARLRPLAIAAAAAAVPDIPWRAWIAIHHVKIAEYSISNLFDPSYLSAHSDRVWPSAHELLAQIADLGRWSFVVALVAVGLAGAVVLGRWRLAIFSTVWLALSFVGLVLINWISTNPLTYHLYGSSYRTIDAIVIGGACLVPLLIRPVPPAS